jgi:hypothetical protein
MSIPLYQKIKYIEKVATEMFNWYQPYPTKYNDDSIINNTEFQDLMKVSRATSYRWRSKNIIGHSQKSNKIYLIMRDIANLLLDNYSALNNNQKCTFRDLIPFFRINNNNETIKVIKSIQK